MINKQQKSLKGQTFIKPFPRKGKFQYEIIKIDEIPQSFGTLINTIWSLTANEMKAGMDKHSLATLAKDCSNYLFETIPWSEFTSAREFINSSNPKEHLRKFYNNYLLNTPDSTPHRLSELVNKNMLNCSGQSLAINEAIKDTNWKIYGEHSTITKGLLRHHTLGAEFGDYMVIVDPATGLQLEQKKTFEDVYVFNKKDFDKQFSQTTYLNKNNNKIYQEKKKEIIF